MLLSSWWNHHIISKTCVYAVQEYMDHAVDGILDKPGSTLIMVILDGATWSTLLETSAKMTLPRTLYESLTMSMLGCILTPTNSRSMLYYGAMIHQCALMSFGVMVLYVCSNSNRMYVI